MQKQINIQNKDVISFYEALDGAKQLAGPKFAYAVFRNINNLKPVVESLSKASLKPKNDEYEKKRLELCEFYADKDENGKPVIKNNTFQIKELNLKAFGEELNKAADETGFTDQVKKFKEELDILLNRYAEFTVFTILSDDLPQGITAEVLDGIKWMVE